MWLKSLTKICNLEIQKKTPAGLDTCMYVFTTPLPVFAFWSSDITLYPKG